MTNHRLRVLLLSLCLAFLPAAASAYGWVADRTVKNTEQQQHLNPPSKLRARKLTSTTVTTSDCNSIRLSPFPAELQLFYEYSVEFRAGRAVSLTDLEQAIANTVAVRLNICDTSGRPVFKVRTDAPHRFSDTICVPKVEDTNGCIVVKGQTSILLDNDSSLVRSRAYEAIENGMLDPELLEGYTDAVARTAFLSRGKALLIEAGQDTMDQNGGSAPFTPITATIAVAAASVSFVVASVFFYGFMRRDGRNHPEPSVRHKGRSLKIGARTVVSDSLGGRARRHFVRLEDLSASPSSYITANLTPMSPDFESYDYGESEVQGFGYEENYNPTVAWSVSDITSDSASLRSGVSRTPSMLERIEEEEEERERDSGSEGDHGKDHIRSETNRDRQKVDDFDCKSLRRHEMMDVSDLDACITIGPLPDDAQTSTGDVNENAEEKVSIGGASMANSILSNDPSEEEATAAPEQSDSDFSGSSLLVQANLIESIDDSNHDTPMSEVEKHDADGNALEYSQSTSETIEFSNGDATSSLQHNEAKMNETEMEVTQDDTNCNEETDDDGLSELLEGNVIADAFEDESYQSAEEHASIISSDHGLPDNVDGEDGEVDTSIEEWVSELLDQTTKEA